MSLPFVLTPEHEATLPSGLRVTYRPFLVKEEKVMLTIKESKDSREILRCMKKVVESCLISGAEPSDLSYNDMEHLFILMRCRSVGEGVDMRHTCKSCGKDSDIKIDISNIGLSKEMPAETTVMLTESVGVTVTPIKIEGMMKIVNVVDKDPLSVLEYVVENVFNDQQVYKFSEMEAKEQKEFVESLSLGQVQKIMAKIEEFPRVCITTTATCLHCGATEELKIEGMENFFT